MKISTPLALKVSSGLAAVGGAGTVFYFRQQGYFSGSAGKEVREEAKKLKKEFESFVVEEGLGVPKKCDVVEKNKNYTTCTLSSDELKKIKFKDLGKEVTVTPNVNVDLKIVGLLGYSGDRNMGLKYLFSNNSGKNIEIKKGDKSIVLKSNGKRGFIEENGELVEEEVGAFGIPKRCESKGNFVFDIFSLGQDKKMCNLYEDDLSRIKFSGLGESEDPISFTWKDKDDFDSQSLMLIIEDNKYVFICKKPKGGTKESPKEANSLTLSRGGNSLELKGEFNPEGDKLKKKTP